MGIPLLIDDATINFVRRSGSAWRTDPPSASVVQRSFSATDPNRRPLKLVLGAWSKIIWTARSRSSSDDQQRGRRS